MVVVTPVGLLFASSAGASPPPKVKEPLKVLGSVSWTKMPSDCAPIFQVCLWWVEKVFVDFEVALAVVEILRVHCHRRGKSRRH